jgi:hypothetical protein
MALIHWRAKLVESPGLGSDLFEDRKICGNLRWIQAVSHPVRHHRRGGAQLDGGAPLRSQTLGRHACLSLRFFAVSGQRQSAYAAQSLPSRPTGSPLVRQRHFVT